MAGGVTGGQTLTPNPNVTAPAGRGGDQWGANGGGITPYSGSDNIASTQSRGQTAKNYQDPARSLGEQESNGSLSAQALDANIPSGGSNQG